MRWLSVACHEYYSSATTARESVDVLDCFSHRLCCRLLITIHTRWVVFSWRAPRLCGRSFLARTPARACGPHATSHPSIRDRMSPRQHDDSLEPAVEVAAARVRCSLLGHACVCRLVVRSSSTQARYPIKSRVLRVAASRSCRILDAVLRRLPERRLKPVSGRSSHASGHRYNARGILCGRPASCVGRVGSD